MVSATHLLSACLVLVAAKYTVAVELTFELADNAHECFYQDIDKGTSVTLEFQVVTGGQYDVDVKLEDPQKKVLFETQKAQFDSKTFTAEETGTYKACFSNEFSTFSHKMVYVSFQVGDEAALPGLEEHSTVLTQFQTSAEEIHKSLNAILDYQTHHRLRETQGRKRAEDLNERVLYWSFFELMAVVIIGISQILVLRNFFTEKKPSQIGGRGRL